MKYTKLGNTGLDVSRLCLGCMTFGAADVGNHSWTLDLDASRPIFRKAVDSGITFFDTANSYSGGTSEQMVGVLLKEMTRREDVVLATKMYFPYETPEGVRHRRGLSRKQVLAEIDASLARLGTDYVDLLQIHRWDHDTPIEETMCALHDVVRSGRARYLGASSMYAWQFAKAQEVARRNGWTPFVSMQNHVNLLYREEEREMIPLCADQGVGLIPWSPMARGRLTRPADEATPRLQTDDVGKRLYDRSGGQDRPVIQAVQDLAAKRGVKMAQIALAWVLAQGDDIAPIPGTKRRAYLEENVEAVELPLSPEDLERLEEAAPPDAAAGSRYADMSSVNR